MMTWETDWWRFLLIIPVIAVYIYLIYKFTRKKKE